jgi:hypothetical protein
VSVARHSPGASHDLARATATFRYHETCRALRSGKKGPPLKWETAVPVSEENELLSLDKLTNPTVKAAIKALQQGDKASWKSLFAANAELFDDGSPRSLEGFANSALGHERFTKIERVENDGCDVYGEFHSDQWGNFKTYFKFHLAPEKKIRRLEIGQA